MDPPSGGDDDEIRPFESASASIATRPRHSTTRAESAHRPTTTRRHSSRRSVLHEEVEPEEDPRVRDASHRRPSTTSHSSRRRRGESRRAASDESSSAVASHDDYPYGHHGRLPYRHVPAPVPPPMSHGGYYPEHYAAQQALIHMPPPADPYGYPHPGPYSAPIPPHHPFSPMDSSSSSGYFPSQPQHRPPPMPRPQSYYGSDVMSAYSAPPMPSYASFNMLANLAANPHLASMYAPLLNQMPPTPTASTEDRKELEALKTLMEKHEEARVAREIAMIKRAEAEAASLAAARAKDEEEKKKKEEIAVASKKAREEAEKKAEETAKKAKEEHEKKLKEIQVAKEAAEKKSKEVEEENKKLKPPPDAGKAIKFKDAVGRKFNFPFNLCKSWKGMEGLIRQAFLHVDVIGDHVRAGHYDLMGPDGEIILPQVWDACVQPDWEISMHMWPVEEKGKHHHHHDPNMIADPFSALGIHDMLAHDGKHRPKRKGSKREKKSSPQPEIIQVGPPPPGLLPHEYPPGFVVDPYTVFAPPPPPSGDERKDKSKRPVIVKARSHKEPTGLAAWFAGGSSAQRRKK